MSPLSSNVWHQKNEQLLTSSVFFAVIGMVEIGVALLFTCGLRRGGHCTALNKTSPYCCCVLPSTGMYWTYWPWPLQDWRVFRVSSGVGYRAEAEVKHAVPLLQSHFCSSQVNTIFPAREIPSTSHKKVVQFCQQVVNLPAKGDPSRDPQH